MQHPPWKPGESGNPAGRPVGAKNAILSALHKQLADEAHAILAVVITKAMGGDMAAAKLLMDRMWPIPKEGGEQPGMVVLNVVTGVRGRD